MSMVGNYLKDITERWLDKEVAVLADIAFDSPEPIEPEAARWARGLRGTGRTSHSRPTRHNLCLLPMGRRRIADSSGTYLFHYAVKLALNLVQAAKDQGETGAAENTAE
jgi:hypothetical protein